MDARSLARALGGEASGNHVLAPGPGHSPQDRSLSIEVDPAAPGGFVVHSFAGQDAIALRDYVRSKGGLEPWKPNGNGKHSPWYHAKHGEPTYVFRYATGVVCRWEFGDGSKAIRPAVEVGGVWEFRAFDKPRPLYRLEKLRPGQVIVVEGEKKADALGDVLKDVSVVSWAGGAEAVKHADWTPLKGRSVIVWPDNDLPGVNAANSIAGMIGNGVRYIEPMGNAKPAKWDAWDAIKKDGWTGDQIIAWAKSRVRVWSPDAPIKWTTAPLAVPERHVEVMPSDTEAPPYSDEALALYFAGLNEGELRYVAHWSRWKIWDGRRWTDDRTMAGLHRVREVCRETAMVYASTQTKSTSGPKAIASNKTVSAVLSLSRSDPRLAATVDQWDTQSGLLNTPAGTLNLDTLQMQPHNPGDHITKMTEVAPGGDCPRWIEFLNQITGGDITIQLFLRRMCGYALTGLTIEHALFFLYGTGANGKSVFINTIGGILGDYHITAPIETFTAHLGDRHPTELARLQGARLVTATETEEGRRWAESRIKMLTGGDRVSARFMKQDFFEYQPTFKLIIAGNHKPGLRTVDEAIRRRFNLIPFGVTIPVANRDEELFNKLRSEWSGIFQWMIGGCREWMQLGLAPPEIVQKATDDYLEAEDAFAAWLEESCDLIATASEMAAALYGSWKAWATRSGEIPGSLKKFVGTLETRGFPQMKRTAAGQPYSGLRLKQQETEADSWYQR